MKHDWQRSMKSRIGSMALLIYVSCALSQDRPTSTALVSSNVDPPPFIAVQIRSVAVQGVCFVERDRILLYSRPRENGYAALATRAANGARVYADVPVRAENCGDSSMAWPDIAAGEVRAATSPSGAPYAQLIVGTPAASSCALHVDLPLLAPAGGGSCAPKNPGVWAYCGCPQLYTDFKAN